MNNPTISPITTPMIVPAASIFFSLVVIPTSHGVGNPYHPFSSRAIAVPAKRNPPQLEQMNTVLSRILWPPPAAAPHIGPFTFSIAAPSITERHRALGRFSNAMPLDG
jgi:hypothetical protein